MFLTNATLSQKYNYNKSKSSNFSLDILMSALDHSDRKFLLNIFLSSSEVRNYAENRIYRQLAYLRILFLGIYFISCYL